MQIEIRIADNIKGTEIPEEVAADIENYEELEEVSKQSKFWITYEFTEEERKTAEKLWKTDFQQLEPEKGRCDFGYNVVQHLPPSKGLRDQLQNGLLLKFCESKPVLIQPKTEEEKLRVEMTQDNKIKQEEILLGVLKIELNTWVTDIMNRKPEVYGKFRFYSIDLLTRPEFMLQNQFFMASLGEKDQKLMEEVTKIAVEEYQKKLQESTDQQQQQKPKDTKAKKDIKKPPPKKGAKDAGPAPVEIEDIEAPEKPEYIVIERNYKSGVEAYLQEKNRAKQEHIKAENAKKKKKEPTEEEKQNEMAKEKEIDIKRMQKYFDVIMGGDINIIVRVKMNGLEVKKPEEEQPVEVKKDDKSKKK